MSTIALSYRAIQRIQKKVVSLDFIKINWKLVYILAAAGCLALLILYIVRVDQLTKGAFLIKNYNKDVTALSVENRSLQSHFAQTSFLGLAEATARGLGFQKTTNVTYIQVLQSSFAEAK